MQREPLHSILCAEMAVKKNGNRRRFYIHQLKTSKYDGVVLKGFSGHDLRVGCLPSSLVVYSRKKPTLNPQLSQSMAADNIKDSGPKNDQNLAPIRCGYHSLDMLDRLREICKRDCK